MTELERAERKRRATLLAQREADPWLTLEEATALLRFNDSGTTRGLALAGRLVGSKINGRWRFRKSNVHAFAEGCRYVTKVEKAEKDSGLFANQ